MNANFNSVEENDDTVTISFRGDGKHQELTAVFTLTKDGEDYDINADLHLSNGTVVSIENCGVGCHVWIEIDSSKFRDDGRGILKGWK